MLVGDRLLKWTVQQPRMTGIISGFAFHSNQTELETLESKRVMGIVTFFPLEFRRKVDLLDEKQYREKRTMLTGRQIMFQIF